MRRQDEIVGVYEGQDEAARHYLLRRLERLPVYADAEQVRKFLDRELAAGPPTLVPALHRALDSVSSRYLARVLAGHSAVAGPSTRRVARVVPRAETVTPPSTWAERRHGWCALARPIVRSLAGALTGPQLQLVLGEAGDDPSAIRLEEGLSTEAAWAAARALCRIGSGRARAALRNAIVSDTAAGHVLSALGDLAGGDVLPDGSRAYGRWPAEYAQALAGLGERGVGPAARLLETGDRPARLHALETLRQLSSPAATPAVVALLGRSGDPLVRAACLCTLESIGDAGAVPAVSEVVRSGSDDLKAAAIETLAAVAPGPDVLREAIRPVESSAQPVVMAAVALAFVGVDTALARGRLVDLLCHPDPLGRLLGIHLLRYVTSASGLRILAEVLHLEKNPILRREAFASLEKYLDLPEVHGPLMDALRSPSPQDRVSAARLLTFCATAPESASLELWLSGSSESDPRVRAWTIRALGRCDRDKGAEACLEWARQGDPDAAWLLDLVRDPDPLCALARTGPAPIRPGAARALVLAGSEAGADALVDLAATRPDEVARIVLEIGGLVYYSAATLPATLTRLVAGGTPGHAPAPGSLSVGHPLPCPADLRQRLEVTPGGKDAILDPAASPAPLVYPRQPSGTIDLDPLSSSVYGRISPLRAPRRRKRLAAGVVALLLALAAAGGYRAATRPGNEDPALSTRPDGTAVEVERARGARYSAATGTRGAIPGSRLTASSRITVDPAGAIDFRFPGGRLSLDGPASGEVRAVGPGGEFLLHAGRARWQGSTRFVLILRHGRIELGEAILVAGTSDRQTALRLETGQARLLTDRPAKRSTRGKSTLLELSGDRTDAAVSCELAPGEPVVLQQAP